jgi:hypothetical protein
VTRFIPRKSLLVLGLLVSVLGFSAAAASASTQPAAPAGHAAMTGQGVVTTAYIHPAGTVPDTQTASLNTPETEPAGICSVPGIGSIGSLFGFCTSGASSSGVLGGLNSICSPSLPVPESANSGIDSIVRPPANSGPQGKTLYDNYGVAGQFWAATGLDCSDMTSLIGNNVAGMVFDGAKAVDRVTISVYQSAAGSGILAWLANVTTRLISSLGNAIYFPYLLPFVLLGVLWLAWQGLIRKRASRTIEGTAWMVVACVAAIWLIGRPADFTGFGQKVSNGVTQVLNEAFSKLPGPAQTSCVPVSKGDPQSPAGGNYGYTSGNGMVDENANELWTVLVCKPWLDGEFGTTTYATGKTGKTPVNSYGRQLLWAQAIAANEKPTSALIQAKQSAYSGIASSIKQNDPAVYPLFQGNQWTSRLEIGFAALFAALVAGVLILLIAVTLIVLKLGFLLLLIVGPFFLLIGTHPGFGRVIAMRWLELIVGVLLKGALVALVLSLLLYAYSLIMGTTDTVLPWALKILMIALVTVAVFIYRKPFQHLFSSVGYSSTDRREQRSDKSSKEMLRAGSLTAAAAASGFAGSRLGRWSRRDNGDSAALADSIAAAGGGMGADPDLAAGQHAGLDGADEYGMADPNAEADADGDGAGVRAVSGGRAWDAAEVDSSGRSAPPLHLPSREGANGQDASGTPSGWARGGAEGTGAGREQSQGADAPRTVTQSGAMIGAGSARQTSEPGRRALPSGTPREAAPRQPADSPARQPSQAPSRQPVQGQVISSSPARSTGPPPSRRSVPAPAGQPPARQTGPAPAPSRQPAQGPARQQSQAPAPARYSGWGPQQPASQPAPRSAAPSSRSAAPSSRSAGPARPAASSGGSGPRARWRDEGQSSQAAEFRGGRPRWRPGPIQSSSGWSGGSGSASAPPPARRQQQSPPPQQQRQSTPPPAPAPRQDRQSPPPPQRQAGPADPPRSYFWSRQENDRQDRTGRAGQAGSGRAGSGQSGAQNGGGQTAPHGPFWLRPVRRKK